MQWSRTERGGDINQVLTRNGTEIIGAYRNHFSLDNSDDNLILKIRDIPKMSSFAGRYVCRNVIIGTNFENPPGAQLVVLGELFVF